VAFCDIFSISLAQPNPNDLFHLLLYLVFLVLPLIAQPSPISLPDGKERAIERCSGRNEIQSKKSEREK
jgi:hypothetical protein